MGCQPSEINKKYEQYKNKYKNKYRLMYGNNKLQSMIALTVVRGYWIEESSRQLKTFTQVKSIPSEPQKGIFSIFGLGYTDYNKEEWAKKIFIEFIQKQESVEIEPKIV